MSWPEQNCYLTGCMKAKIEQKRFGLQIWVQNILWNSCLNSVPCHTMIWSLIRTWLEAWDFPILPCMWEWRGTNPSFYLPLRWRQNGRHFADDILKCIFLNENVWISIRISLKFVPRGAINDIPALVHIMAWRLVGDKTLFEPMMVSLLTHICVILPQWVNHWGGDEMVAILLTTF